jgi:hypothetical protein
MNELFFEIPIRHGMLREQTDFFYDLLQVFRRYLARSLPEGWFHNGCHCDFIPSSLSLLRCNSLKPIACSGYVNMVRSQQAEW